MFANATLTPEAADVLHRLATGAHLGASKEAKAAENCPKMKVIGMMEARLVKFREELKTCKWTLRVRTLRKEIKRLEHNIQVARKDEVTYTARRARKHAERLGGLRRELNERKS